MNKKIIYYLFLISLIPAIWFLLKPGYFSMHDDLQVMRIFQIEKCLADGQIPCRWVPDMAFGYGQAMFNFYGPLPYYLGAFARMLLPISIMATVKLLFITSFLAGAWGMFLLARRFWGVAGGILAAILYTYAPYHALDIYVRGALSESLALALLPFIWLVIYDLIKKTSYQKVFGLAFLLFALFTTHNISSLIYAPFTIAWALFWIIRLRRWKSFYDLFLSGVLGIGLAGFFLLPAIIEQNLIQTNFLTQEYFFYEAHFVSIRQLLIERMWGYGASTFGPNDDLSLQVGWPHWWLALPLIIISFSWWKKNKDKDKVKLIFLLLGSFVLATFLTHLRSVGIWRLIPALSFTQFPWRFLGLSIFFISFASGAFGLFDFKYRKILLLAIFVLTISLNVDYFKPEHYWANTDDQEKLTGIQFELQQKAAILDYLPKTTPMAPKELAFKKPQIVKGEGFISNYSVSSNRFFFDAEIYQESEVEIPIINFPNWVVISSNKIIPSNPVGKYGVIGISLPQGKHIIQGRFENTPIRNVGNVVTLLSGAFVFIGFTLKANGKKFLWL